MTGGGREGRMVGVSELECCAVPWWDCCCEWAAGAARMKARSKAAACRAAQPKLARRSMFLLLIGPPQPAGFVVFGSPTAGLFCRLAWMVCEYRTKASR